MAEKGRRVLMIAGEASGDLHGSSLIKALLAIDPGLKFYGMGGRRMIESGLTPIYDSSRLAIVGITEAFKKLPDVVRAYLRLKETISTNPPDIAILIDYPDFNLTFASNIKKKGIPIIYFISPQIWAWRKGRLKKIAKLVDKMIVIFPFEVPLYEEAGVDVEFLGNPLLDEEGLYISRDRARESLGLKEKGRVIGILPGSRITEIDRLLPLMLDASRILLNLMPEVTFLLPVAEGISPAYIEGMVKGRGLPVKVFNNSFYEVLKASDVVVVASGTATLQAALAGVPMVVVYKVSPLTYWIGKHLINIDKIALVNIVAGEGLVEELIQSDATPQNIARGILRLFDEGTRDNILKGFLKVRERMGSIGASQRIARSIYGFMTDFMG